jgi:hypothetical protein
VTAVTPTPGQVVYEAHQAFMIRRFPGIAPIGWRELSGEAQGEWEGIAQAGTDARVAALLKAPDGGALVVAFRDEVTPEEAKELHERWGEYGPETVSLVIVDDVAAIAAYKPRWTEKLGPVVLCEHEQDAAPELAAITAERDALRERAEAAEAAKRAAKGELADLENRLSQVIAAALMAERARIRELADRTGAVCTGDEGTSHYFSALLTEASDG